MGDQITRLDIDVLLNAIPVGSDTSKKERQKRNKKRHDAVKNHLEQKYPGKIEIHQKILADLISYQGWEDEESA